MAALLSLRGGAPYLEERPAESTALARGSEVLNALVASGQTHLVAGWDSGEPDLAAQRRLKLQLASLDATLHGGVGSYVGRAKELLAKDRDGVNPFDGYMPSIPTGFPLKIGEESFACAESAGAAASRGVAFVLVAGGLGERLGYSGIKLAMPADSLSGVCYLELYAQHILALQALHAPPAEAGASADQQRPRSAKDGLRIPLVIMTSDDTDAATRELLARHANFGLAPSQLHIVKQDKVPCLTDNAASLALDPADPYALLTKPHGHGDVHALLHTSGIARRLLSQGCTHLVFLQDTNANVFGGVTAALGVSVTEDLAMNTISVPRGAGDAAGALMTLRSEARDKTVTVNVEYNQLDALVRATLDPKGDVNGPTTGASPFPGNTNQLIFRLDTYVPALEASAGAMPEFVNPKYTDSSRTAFKSPTRLECMMQDFPWVMPAAAKIGFTLLDTGFYSPVKNSRADAAKKAAAGQASGGAAAGEYAVFGFHGRLLTLAGCDVPPPRPSSLGGAPLLTCARISLSPAFRPTVGAALRRLPQGGASVSVTERSSLRLDGDITVLGLELDGALSVRAVPGARVTIRRLVVRNAGDVPRELTREEVTSTAGGAAELARLRGYVHERREVREIVFDEPGVFDIEE